MGRTWLTFLFRKGDGEACLYAYGNDPVEERLMFQDRKKEGVRAKSIHGMKEALENCLVRAGMHFLL